MKEETRKDKEYILIKNFLDNYEDSPKATLIPYESPDFILRLNRKTAIGIELTQIFPEKLKSSYEEIVSELQNAIQKKTAKLKIYQKNKFNEYWLVVVVDDLQIKNLSEFQEYLIRCNLTTKFNKVFLFDLFDSKILTIS